MAEVLFYHLTQSPLEHTLPDLLEKSLQRGWRAVVKSPHAERLKFLDDRLWSYREDSFLPHGISGTEQDSSQPVLLTDQNAFPNAPDIAFIVDGAEMENDAIAEFTRVCIMFDGNDPSAVDAARQDWKRITSANIRAVYWSQETGKWQQKAVSDPTT